MQITDLNRYLYLTEQLAIKEARNSLLPFTLFTKRDYTPNWFHKSYSRALDKFISGEIKRLMVFCPPQHGKSELCSRRMPSLILGKYPNKKLCVVSYNHSFASKFNRDVQRIIDSPEYSKLFPNVRISKKVRNNDLFEIEDYQGSLISVGVGGGLTGNKIDVAVVDDPYKDAVQANSQAYKNTLFEWWDSVLETRLDNNAQICLTFTRWRADDIGAKLLEFNAKGLEKWHLVKYEALKESENEDPLDKRELGAPLWGERHSKEKLERMREKNPSVFRALYQQDPVSKEGNFVKRSYFFRFTLDELPSSIPINAYIDTATSEKELKHNDPTGILLYSQYRGKLYLMQFFKGYWSLPELTKKIIDIHSRFMSGRRSKIYIENKSNARSVKQTLLSNPNAKGINIILDNIKYSKLERLENELPVLEANRVGIPLNEMWVEDFLLQVTGFPLLKHDEEIDCLTGSIRKSLKSKKAKLV